MSTPEDEVMAEFRNAWYKVRGTLHAVWNAMSRRNQPAQSQPRPQPGVGETGRIPNLRETMEGLRDSTRHDPEVAAATRQLGGPETVRLSAAEARTFAEMTGPGGDLNELRNLNSFAGVGQPGADQAARMAPGTATAAQTPVEAGHRTQPQRSAPTRPGLGV